MNKYWEIFKQKKFLTVIGVVFLLAVLYIIVKMLTNIYITIQFDELAQFESNMPVYYKGFRVGRTRSIRPDKDFKHTLIKVVLDYKELKLPKNTTALVKKIDKGEKEGRFDYIDLIYPDSPSIYYLKTGSYIKGRTSLDWSTLLSQQADKGNLDDISDGIGNLLDSLKDTSDSLNTIFQTLNEILAENRPNIMDATSNLSKTTNNPLIDIRTSYRGSAHRRLCLRPISLHTRRYIRLLVHLTPDIINMPGYLIYISILNEI